MKKHRVVLLTMIFSVVVHADFAVFAAASTTDVMEELAERFEAEGGETVRFNFASSGALARQIDAGAPAELYVSANTKWMDWLAAQGLLEAEPVPVVRNELVLIAPLTSRISNDEQGMSKDTVRRSTFFTHHSAVPQGMLAVGDFQSVPAGTYAEAALTSLGWLDDVQGRLVKGASVRTVLMYIERGEIDAGIVYRTDALQSDRVNVLGTFPSESHPPIVYPAACLKGSGDSAKAFLDFIRSPAGRDIWKTYGFVPIENELKGLE